MTSSTPNLFSSSSLSYSSVQIIGLPGFLEEGLSIDKACAEQPDHMRALGFEIFRQVRRHRDLSADSNLLYLEDRFQAVLKETWLNGHRTVKPILDVCLAKLNDGAIEGVLFEHGGAQAVIGFYLAMQKNPRKLIRIIDGLMDDSLVEFAKMVGKFHADASITAWIREKFEKSKRRPIKYPLARVPRRKRKRTKNNTPNEDSDEDSEDDSQEGDQVTETNPSKRKRTSSATGCDIEGVIQRRKSPVLQMPLRHPPSEKASQGESPQSAIHPTPGEHYDNSTEQALESGLEANKKDTVPEPSIEASASVLMEEEDHAQLATDLLESEWPGPSQYFDQRLYELTTTEPEWGYPRDTTEHFNSRGLSDVF